MSAMKVLMILTSHSTLGPGGKPTGLWLEELAIPWALFQAAQAEITLASPRGGPVPIDPRSLTTENQESKAVLANPATAAALRNTVKLEEVSQLYDVVFVPGGHGTMYDLPTSPDVARILSQHYANGKVVAAVCHGPAAFVGAKKPDGSPLISGHRFSAFSDDEERAMELERVMPFMLETQLTQQGGHYEKAAMWQPKVVRDGMVVTGQNPASSRLVAQESIAAFQASK